jgi:Family of unknown function (DUF6504)
MTRLHADPVEVRRRDDAPEQFLWRGRLYLVRAVLARWTESGGWWRSDVTPVLGGSVDGSLDDGEREWWRVEAGSGRLAALSDIQAAGTGVYDLCFDWSRGAWSLARVLD